MTKTLICIISLFFLMTQVNHAQDFDSSLAKVIGSITKDLNNYDDNFQIAIYPFKFKKENEDVLAEYVTEEFWDLMPKSAINYEVIDRATFDEYFKEHKLKSRGLIDPKTEKQFGMLIAADAYITGMVYVFNSIIRLRVTVTDTQTGKIITTESGKLPITYDIANYIGLKDWKETREEAEKNKSSNPNCDKENVGDICFENNSNTKYVIKIQDIGKTLSSTYRTITVNGGNRGCIKDLPPISFYFSVSVSVNGFKVIEEGNFQIKTCQSEIIELK